jgi:hypothetical protein
MRDRLSQDAYTSPAVRRKNQAAVAGRVDPWKSLLPEDYPKRVNGRVLYQFSHSEANSPILR